MCTLNYSEDKSIYGMCLSIGYIVSVLCCDPLYVYCSVPDAVDVEVGSIEQGSACVDTMGHTLRQGLGMYMCHHMGGNQVDISLLSLILNRKSSLCFKMCVFY